MTKEQYDKNAKVFNQVIIEASKIIDDDYCDKKTKQNVAKMANYAFKSYKSMQEANDKHDNVHIDDAWVGFIKGLPND